MPSPVVSEKRSPQLLTVLFWIGVALAPIAALILLFADGNGPLRFAAVLAITAVVLIGLSIALRADGGSGSSDAEVLDELEQLRRELRSEIVAAAQRGNQALDQSQRTEEQVTALRRRLDATAAELAAAAVGAPVAEDRAAGAGRARVPAVEPAPEAPVGRRRAAAEESTPDWGPADDAEPSGAGRGRAATDREAAAPPSRRYAPERPTTGQAGVYGASGREARDGMPAAESAARPLGVVRHTETVHVTTRHTVVDGPDPTNGYGGGYAGRWTPGPEQSSWAGGEPERPWSGQAEPPGRDWSAPSDDRSRGARPPSRDERSWPAASGPSWGAPADDRESARPDPARPDSDRPEWSPAGGEAGVWSSGGRAGWAGARAEPPAPEVHAGDRWAEARADPPAREVRAGDRWAEVRDDGRAREVRVGERRAAVHADGAGYHYSDRWASVRQEDAYRDEPGRTGERWAEDRSAQDDRPALPAGGVPVPQQWREPARSHRPAEERPARASQSVQSTPEWSARTAPPVQPAPDWSAPAAPPARDRPGRAAQPGGEWPARTAPQPAPDWSARAGQSAPDRPASTGQPAPDRPARGDDQRWGGQPAEQWRDREPVVSWRTPEPEPEPRGHQQWGGEERYGYPPQDDAPRAGGHWR
ncbi:hypothetical protein GA0070216_109128 [Micromonospora matsumotoense]|uniref:Uncharacterized protein n=1 Tax=Micromonospora matsumotoense TaxID=121616 RepID=A0A1C4ZE64_9ACTN|nr:hypothetical protein [Micromonospora matsumotoense]SCF31258.1 hypothetical protein GA0070216_109128 [Micromonospora matsumotoense]